MNLFIYRRVSVYRPQKVQQHLKRFNAFNPQTFDKRWLK